LVLKVNIGQADAQRLGCAEPRIEHQGAHDVIAVFSQVGHIECAQEGSYLVLG